MRNSVPTESATTNHTHSRLHVSQILDSMSQSELDDIVAVAQIEPHHLKQLSNPKEIADDVNKFVAEQDFELNDIAEDLADGVNESIILEQIESNSKQKWNENKKKLIHQQLQQYIETTTQQQQKTESLSKDNNEQLLTPHQTMSSRKQSNAKLLQEIIQIAPLMNEEQHQRANYSNLFFVEYECEHIAQFIFDETEREFNENGKDCDLYRIVFDDEINGIKLKQNLSEDWLKSAINNKIKDGKHKLKKATIKQIMDDIAHIDENWQCEQVFEFLYFAECALLQNAIINLQIDGKEFADMDTKEWSKRLKAEYKIPLSVSQGYYNQIVCILS